MTPIPSPKSVTETVAEQIREAIILGAFPLGTKLSEQKLADQLNVSRSPVREALVLLQIEGLVRVFAKRGSFVCQPDTAMTRDLSEHRAILETACLGLALERNPALLINGMRAGLEHMERAIKVGNTNNYSRGDLMFHRAIVLASGNRSMIKTYGTTIGPLMALRTHLFTMTGIQLDQSMDEHAAMLRACIAGDAQGAQSICARHIHRLAHHMDEASQAPSEGKPAAG